MATDNSFYAIDFGTSNSLLSFVPDGGKPVLIPLDYDGNTTLKSLLYTPRYGVWFFGREAILQYQEDGGEGRFFRSIKKFLPEANHTGTEVYGKKIKIEELITLFLRTMKERADKVSGSNITNLVMGRPALYSLDPAEDKLAEERMLIAAQNAGFKKVIFCPEPLAAGLDFTANAKVENFVLIADFGGGTSDFTLLKMHPNKYSPEDVLGMSGIFLAGDSIDGNIMRHFISPHFGKNFEYKTPIGDNVHQFPRHLLTHLCSPAQIVLLRERNIFEFLKDIQKWSITGEDRRVLDQLFTLIEHQLGYPLYREIERAKIDLGEQPETLFSFDYPGIKIRQPLVRTQFEEKACEIVDKIILTMMQVFEQSGMKTQQVDHICITGGTGQLPLIRQRLIEIFGEEKITEHKIFQSVVDGLAKYAQMVQNK